MLSSTFIVTKVRTMVQRVTHYLGVFLLLLGGCQGSGACSPLSPSLTLEAQPEVPFEAYSTKKGLSPAQRQLISIYRSRHDVAIGSGWSVRFFEVEQPWISELRLIASDGYLDAGHGRIPGQIIGIDGKRVVEIGIRERYISHSQPIKRVVEGIYTCRWGSKGELWVSEELVRDGACRDRTKQLLSSLHARSKSVKGGEDPLVLARSLTDIIIKPTLPVKVVMKADKIPPETRWHGVAPVITDPTVSLEGDALRAKGFLKCVRWVSAAYFEFDLEARGESLSFTLTDVGELAGTVF